MQEIHFTRKYVAVVGEDEDLMYWARAHGVQWDLLYEASTRIGDIEVRYLGFRPDIWENSDPPEGGWDSIYNLQNTP